MKANAGKGMMTGKVKCGYCTEPLRDHEGYGPCVWWEVGLVKDEAHMNRQKHARVYPPKRKRKNA
jgi:hypothetical protein